MLTLFSVGCPEPGDLENANSYPLPPTGAAGTSSTAGSTGTAGSSSSSGAECEVACMTTALTSCKVCHGQKIKLVPMLDLETAGYTALLKNQPAQYVGADATKCTPGAKLIDTAAPANSWFLKKVKNDVGMCGTAMPPPPDMVAPADLKCFEDYVACVSGAAPAGAGGT